MAQGIPAGRPSRWLLQVLPAVEGRGDSDVPCGGCTACCASSQFVLVGPDEHATLAAVPAELLFPAPRLPGHRLLAYDQHGRCPMLGDSGCTIYDSRPRACRTYDCRVLAAAGVDAAADGKPAIAARVASWRFDVDADDDRLVLAAVRLAADFLRTRADALPDDVRPVNGTGLAVLALRLHHLFLPAAAGGDPPPLDAVVATAAA